MDRLPFPFSDVTKADVAQGNCYISDKVEI